MTLERLLSLEQMGLTEVERGKDRADKGNIVDVQNII